MLTINIVAVGKIKEKYFTDALNEYSKRLSKFCRLNIMEVKDEPQGSNAAETVAILAKEGAAILAKIPKDSYIFALCIEGAQRSSVELATEISKLQVDGTSSITFVIGGSEGLSDEVKSRANARISFSKMTFPHQLARVMLAEQLYRAFKILSGQVYHK